MTETLLILSPIGVPLYSARGLTQTLTPSPEAKPTPRRTWNGELRWLGQNQMRKYDSEITCTDQQAPAFGGAWPGDIITVNCVCELAYADVTGATPERTVVGGSSHVIGEFVYYRPQITFMVLDYDVSNDEYKHDYAWKLSLREV